MAERTPGFFQIAERYLPYCVKEFGVAGRSARFMSPMDALLVFFIDLIVKYGDRILPKFDDCRHLTHRKRVSAKLFRQRCCSLVFSFRSRPGQ